MILTLAALLLAQEPRPDLARDLSDESIEVRERAHAALLKMGAPGYPILRRALDGPDAEARLRAAAILESPAFAAVPEVIEANIGLLREKGPERWPKALEDLFIAGPPAIPALRKAAESKEARLAFRARQVAAILESTPVRGLMFGIFVEEPQGVVEGSVAGWDVLINASSDPLRIEAARQSVVYPYAEKPTSFRGSSFGSAG